MHDIGTMLFLAAYALQFTPEIFWFSAAVTLAHTYEESFGEIWRDLKLPAASYFVFQAAILALAWFGTVEGHKAAAVTLIVLRLVDFGYTHTWRQLAGALTAPFLLIDAVFIASWVMTH